MCFIPSVLHEISSWLGRWHCFGVENVNVNTRFVMDRWLGAEHKCMGLGHCQTCIWGGRSNEGLHAISPAPNSACDSLLGTPRSHILFTSEFSSAIMPFTEDSNMFSAMLRAEHHENTLNLTLKWNKSSGKCLLRNYKEITESRAELQEHCPCALQEEGILPLFLEQHTISRRHQPSAA